MKKKMEARANKEELIQYLSVLQGLKSNGFKCEQEISQAVKELNLLMFPNHSSFDRVDIFVLEDTLEGFYNSLKLFANIMQKPTNGRTYGTMVTYANQNTLVRICNISDIDRMKDRLRGYRADLIINNTATPTQDLGILLPKVSSKR